MKPLLIALDGPVAAGKSNVGRLLARKLGYIFFDTGMMYRALTWKVLKLGIPPDDESRLCHLASTTKFDFVPSQEGHLNLLIDNENLSSSLLCPQVEEQVSVISKIAGVRQVMVSEQRRLAQRGKVVMAGRDIGTVVLPWAELKIFLVASPEERANRRYKELLERGERVDYSSCLADLKRRDEIDAHRAISPLKPAADAVIIDTEELDLEQVVDKIYALVVELDSHSSPSARNEIKTKLRMTSGGSESATLSQKIVLAILRPFFRIFLSWKVKGKESVPLTGALIVVANHVHLVDPILLVVSFPRWISFMAKAELFRSPLLRPIIRWTQAFPVRRQGMSRDKREAMKQAKDILDKGLVLGMFPEGERSRKGKLRIGKPGSAVMASRMGVPILPVGITGTDKIKGIGWLWRRPSIVINIGQPFELPSVDGRLTKSQIRLLTNQLMNRIAVLLPVENRGVYGD